MQLLCGAYLAIVGIGVGLGIWITHARSIASNCITSIAFHTFRAWSLSQKEKLRLKEYDCTFRAYILRPSIQAQAHIELAVLLQHHGGS